MAILRHGSMLLFFLASFCSSLGFAFVACPQVNGSEILSRECGSRAIQGQDGGYFDDCVVRNQAMTFHAVIQDTLRNECAIEQEVARMEVRQQDRERQAHIGGYDAPAPLQLPPEYQEVMHRLRPTEYAANGDDGFAPSGTATYRSNDCFGGHVGQQLREAIQANCPTAEIHQECAQAGATRAEAERSMQEMRRRFEAIDAALQRSRAGLSEIQEELAREGIQYDGIWNEIKSSIQSMANQLNNVADQNEACSQALVTLRGTGCTQTYEDYFSDSSRREMIGKYCTHAAIDRSINQFVNFMRNDDASPHRTLDLISQDHNDNRIKEGEMASWLQDAYNNTYVPLLPIFEPESVRQPAAVTASPRPMARPETLSVETGSE